MVEEGEEEWASLRKEKKDIIEKIWMPIDG